MKSRIILFIVVVLTVNSLSVVYGDEVKTLQSVRYTATIPQTNRLLNLAGLFNLDIGFRENKNRNRAYNVTIMARKTIFSW